MIRPNKHNEDGLPVEFDLSDHNDDGLPLFTKKKVSLGAIGGKVSFNGGIVGNGAGLLEKQRLANYLYELKNPEQKAQSKPRVFTTSSKPFKKNERPFDETKEQAQSGIGSKVKELVTSTDPIGDADKKSKALYQNNVKESIHYDAARSMFNDEVDSLQGARNWLHQDGKQFDPNNQTDIAAKKREDEFEGVKNNLAKNGGDITRSAIEHFAQDEPDVATVLAAGEQLPHEMQGRLVQRYLNNRNVKELAATDKEFHNRYMEQRDNFRTNYPDLWTNDIVNKIAQGREDQGRNNPFLNIVGVKSSDDVIESLFMRGEIDEWDKKQYYKNVRPLLDFHIKSIKTTGIVERAFESILKGAEDIPKGVYSLTGIHNLITSKEERAKDRLQEQEVVGEVQPKGIVSKVATATGDLGGVLVPMGLTGKALKLAGIIKNPAIANQVAMGATFFEDMYKDAERNNPNGGYLNQLQATIQSVIFAKINPTFGALSRTIVKDATPEIKSILQKLKNQSLTGNQAKESIVNVILGKAAGVAKSSLKTSAEMSVATGLSKTVGDLFVGKFDPEGTINEAGHTFEHMMLGTPLLGLLHVAGKKTPQEQLLEHIKSQPEVAKEEQTSDLQYFIDKAAETPVRSSERFGKEVTAKLLEQVPTEKLHENYESALRIGDPENPEVLALDKILKERGFEAPELKPEKEAVSIEDQKLDIEKRRQEEKDKYDISKGGTLPIEGYEKTYADIDAKYDAELKALETKPQSNEQAIKPKGEEVSGEARQKIQAEEANKQAEKKAELESQRDAEILREKMPEMKDVNEVVPSVEEVDAGSKDSVELSRNKKMRQNLKNKYSELKKLFECLTK